MLKDYLYYQDDLVTLYLGNCKEIMELLDDESIDLIATDPPYSKKYLSCYKDLASSSYRIMKDKAMLLTLLGHNILPEVVEVFSKTQLKYKWITSMIQEGQHAKLFMGIEVGWKPLLWYCKGKRVLKGVKDFIYITKNDGVNKQLHKWQQSLDWALWCIDNFSKPGEVVLDPFVGSGTMPFACKMRNRKCIGIEIDAQTIEIAKRRINQVSLQFVGE